MKKKTLKLMTTLLLVSVAWMWGTSLVFAEKVKITIESWRNDDLLAWQEEIIPAFNKKHPDIEVVFTPTAPTEYNSALNARLTTGTAGDLITCRPFGFEGLYAKGQLMALNDLKGINDFTDFSKSAWVASDGTPYCLPMASVIHGFIYNAEIFEELEIKVPTTEKEFFAALETIKNESRYTPLAMGTNDQWEASHMAFQNIGPNYWKGEEGRLSIVKGTGKLTDAGWVKTFETIAKWQPYLSRGYQAQSYPDSQNLFTIGRAAIYPSGSWEIGGFNKQADFKMGAFYPPPKAGEKCYISDELDMGMGINPASKNVEAAKTFLQWMTTAEFAKLFNTALPGFFALSKHKVELSNPLVKAFVGFRDHCDSTLRSASTLNQGTPNLDTEIWAASAEVINGTLSPQDAAKRLQTGLESWYKPQQN